MPRMQVYLPIELYEEVKGRNLPASELLQNAIRAELNRQKLLDETDRYLAEAFEELGPPTEEEVAQAEAWADRIQREGQLNTPESEPLSAPAHS